MRYWRLSTVTLQPELWSAVTLSLSEGTSIEVRSTLLRTNIKCLSLTLEVKLADREKLAAVFMALPYIGVWTCIKAMNTYGSSIYSIQLEEAASSAVMPWKVKLHMEDNWQL